MLWPIPRITSDTSGLRIAHSPALPYGSGASPLLFDGEFRPPRQRRRPVVQEHDAARLGERQIGAQRAVVDDELLQDLAIVRVGGIQPGALGEQPAAPAHGNQTGAVLASGG